MDVAVQEADENAEGEEIEGEIGGEDMAAEEMAEPMEDEDEEMAELGEDEVQEIGEEEDVLDLVDDGVEVLE